MAKFEGEALYAAAVKAHRKRDLMKAGALYAQFVRVNPRLPAAWDQLGRILAELGNVRDAEECWLGIVQFMPDYPHIGQVYSQLCRALAMQGREEALAYGRKAVEIDPRSESAWLTLGTALETGGIYEEALDCFERAAALGGQGHQFALYKLKRSICAWDGLDALEKRLLHPSYEWHPEMLFCYFGFLPTTPAAQRQTAARATGKSPHPYFFPVGQPVKAAGRKIRLGFLSFDFRDHATSALLASTFENFDRARFELHAFSTGPADDGEYAGRIRRAVDGFYDVSQAIDTEIAAHIMRCGVDILFDVGGYAKGNRWGILARRPAPIQVNYLAWPGTMGAEFIDYMVADKIVAPEPAWFSEKLLHLDCYQPTDDKRPEPRTPERSRLGLPDEALVLCSMNAAVKITPMIMAQWCEILRELPSVVLWQYEDNPLAAGKLKEFARQRGVAEQLAFAPPVPFREHIDRISVADLALDTFPYGGHTTTSDLLWAGVPVVTLMGQSFVSRVATSLLHAVGMPELSTTTLSEYKALIPALCRDRPRLAALKAQLTASRRSCSLFDNKRYTRALEAKLIALVA